ncbi:hypothetical protein E2C01_013557 [Portunus trituberculatus]|uniref:Uncharacterized protein n=1 Tax=Portunus trituberculatus TaxID=210409 RepID=A0A5B7DGK2_PORTR|nr:hypothetical protein [Portunus trituberculatus]
MSESATEACEYCCWRCCHQQNTITKLLQLKRALVVPPTLVSDCKNATHEPQNSTAKWPLNEKMPEPPPPPAPHPHRGGSAADSVVENGSSSSTPNQMPAVSPSHVLGHLHSPQYTPASGGGVPQSRESVEAAIADIKQAIRRTKNLPVKSHPQERSPVNDKAPVWIPRCDDSGGDDGGGGGGGGGWRWLHGCMYTLPISMTEIHNTLPAEQFPEYYM